MHFPKFWARGEHESVSVWRWSDSSLEDAQQQASARAIELAKMFAEQGRRFDRYSYGSRPLREEIVQTGAELVVSRNLYGALVLNASRAMFIDIDLGDEVTAQQEQQGMTRVRAWAEGHRELALRVYRTYAGLRALVTSHVFDPKTEASTALLNEIGSDPLYVKLCHAQSSFRARLTAKPWRVGVHPPRTRFPFESDDEAAQFRAWQAEYDLASLGFSACRHVATLNDASVHDEIAPVLEIHDRLACGDRLA
jgi:hypothetical protein